MSRETEEELPTDERARLARLACGEGEAIASGDLVRAAALRVERRALLERLAKARRAKTQSSSEQAPT